MQAVQRLHEKTEALAALGCAMGARDGSTTLSAGLQTKIERVVRALGPEVGQGLDPRQAEMLRGAVRSLLRQALDLVENPTREATSISDDPVVLQAQGRAYRAVVPVIAKFIAEDAALAERLNGAARFLDVGCGVGRVALDVAERWPSVEVDGVDLFAPALALAEINRASAVAGDRVAFHRSNLTTLNAEARYAAAFAPIARISREAFPNVSASLFKALEAGGRVFVAFETVKEDALAQALSELRVARAGGHAWSSAGASSVLLETGFEKITSAQTEDGAITMVAARKIV